MEKSQAQAFVLDRLMEALEKGNIGHVNLLQELTGEIKFHDLRAAVYYLAELGYIQHDKSIPDNEGFVCKITKDGIKQYEEIFETKSPKKSLTDRLNDIKAFFESARNTSITVVTAIALMFGMNVKNLAEHSPALASLLGIEVEESVNDKEKTPEMSFDQGKADIQEQIMKSGISDEYKVILKAELMDVIQEIKNESGDFSNPNPEIIQEELKKREDDFQQKLLEQGVPIEEQEKMRQEVEEFYKKMGEEGYAFDNHAEEFYSDGIEQYGISFIVDMQEEGVHFYWDKAIKGDFAYYKLMYSPNNPNPVYPNDENVYIGENVYDTEYFSPYDEFENLEGYWSVCHVYNQYYERGDDPAFRVCSEGVYVSQDLGGMPNEGNEEFDIGTEEEWNDFYEEDPLNWEDGEGWDAEEYDPEKGEELVE